MGQRGSVMSEFFDGHDDFGESAETGASNADHMPLFEHADGPPSKTAIHVKVTRLDGDTGIRGYKGQVPPSATAHQVASRYGNGMYKLEACNSKGKVLAREDQLEISIPEYEPKEAPRPAQAHQAGPSPAFGLHSMKMMSDMSATHHAAIREASETSSNNVQAMAAKSMDMMTAFTAAQRESERAGHESAQLNQQQFFASMLAQQTLAHAQQMEMLTATNERERSSTVDPMQMIEMFMTGMRAGGEMGGDGPEPWVTALQEGSGMMKSLAELAIAPGAGRGPAPLAALPSPAKAHGQPGATRRRVQRRPPSRRPANGAHEQAIQPEPPAFSASEMRELAELRAKIQERGVPFGQYLEQSRVMFSEAPDSDLFSENDGPGESVDAATSPEHPLTQEAPTADTQD